MAPLGVWGIDKKVKSQTHWAKLYRDGWGAQAALSHSEAHQTSGQRDVDFTIVYSLTQSPHKPLL